jgi:hypothetical protein
MRQLLMFIDVLLVSPFMSRYIVALDGEFFKAPPALQAVHAVASAAPAA